MAPRAAKRRGIAWRGIAAAASAKASAKNAAASAGEKHRGGIGNGGGQNGGVGGMLAWRQYRHRAWRRGSKRRQRRWRNAKSAKWRHVGVNQSIAAAAISGGAWRRQNVHAYISAAMAIGGSRHRQRRHQLGGARQRHQLSIMAQRGGRQNGEAISGSIIAGKWRVIGKRQNQTDGAAAAAYRKASAATSRMAKRQRHREISMVSRVKWRGVKASRQPA